MKIKRSWPFVGIVVLAALAFWESPFFPEYDPYCEYENSKHEYCATYHVVSIIFGEIGKFLDAHNGAVAALAGIAVAAFTFYLKRSTDKLWKAGREALETTERAFVFVGDFHNELTTQADTEGVVSIGSYDPGLVVTRFAVQPRWTNSGRTPTKRMCINVDWGLGDTTKVGTYRTLTRQFFVGPKAIVDDEIIEMGGAPNSLINGGYAGTTETVPLLLIWGRADYEDVFNKPHFVEWCYRVRPERHGRDPLRAHFIQWGEYNRTEESA